ncbi:MAG: MarR family winged helix-turn-helix transcriptional regulator [Turicibacter sp.]
MKSNLRHRKKDVLHGVMMRVNRSHRKLIREELTKVNLTEGKPKILDFLFANSGCSQRELSQSCHIEPATVSSILTIMENDSLIYRDRNEKDKRVINVFLTEKGYEAYEQVERIFTEVDAICFKGFTEEEKVMTIQLLNKMNENIRERAE